jgi:hypothetical protein
MVSKKVLSVTCLLSLLAVVMGNTYVPSVIGEEDMNKINTCASLLVIPLIHFAQSCITCLTLNQTTC